MKGKIEELQNIMICRMAINQRTRVQFHLADENNKIIEILKDIDSRLEKLESQEGEQQERK